MPEGNAGASRAAADLSHRRCSRRVSQHFWRSISTRAGPQFIEDLVELHLPNLRICVTSRPEADILEALGPLASHTVSLHDEDGQKQDIVDYVTFVVHSDRKMRKWRAEIRS
jgi:hypothetical protein